MLTGQTPDSAQPRRPIAPPSPDDGALPPGVSFARIHQMGDWLSGRALASHARGHWFEPSIAHHVDDMREMRCPRLRRSGWEPTAVSSPRA